MTLGLKYSRRI